MNEIETRELELTDAEDQHRRQDEQTLLCVRELAHSQAKDPDSQETCFTFDTFQHGAPQGLTSIQRIAAQFEDMCENIFRMH